MTRQEYISEVKALMCEIQTMAEEGENLNNKLKEVWVFIEENAKLDAEFAKNAKNCVLEIHTAYQEARKHYRIYQSKLGDISDLTSEFLGKHKRYD